jgi:hypothetical protein
MYLHTSTSSDLFAQGSGVKETRIVSQIQSCNNNQSAIELDTIPFAFHHASVSHKCSGTSVFSLNIRYAKTIS